MKRLSGILSYVVAGLCIMGTVRASAQGGAYERWHGDKYSMFIHFGLYSVAASFIQLIGYGTGFLRAWWNRCILGKDEFEAFKKNFYK